MAAISPGLGRNVPSQSSRHTLTLYRDRSSRIFLSSGRARFFQHARSRRRCAIRAAQAESVADALSRLSDTLGVVPKVCILGGTSFNDPDPPSESWAPGRQRASSVLPQSAVLKYTPFRPCCRRPFRCAHELMRTCSASGMCHVAPHDRIRHRGRTSVEDSHPWHGVLVWLYDLWGGR